MYGTVVVTPTNMQLFNVLFNLKNKSIYFDFISAHLSQRTSTSIGLRFTSNALQSRTRLNDSLWKHLLHWQLSLNQTIGYLSTSFCSFINDLVSITTNVSLTIAEDIAKSRLWKSDKPFTRVNASISAVDVFVFICLKIWNDDYRA